MLDMFRHIARSYMALRECLVPNRKREAQEEVVADLHTCLEQLSQRTAELEARINQCAEKAMYHFQLSKKEQTGMARTRERQRAKMYMEDRRRVITEHDKALRMTHALQAQIDSIVSSHVDMMILETMRGYNATAASLAMPQRASEIERLGEELADRHSEVNALQDAISGVTIACGSSASDTFAGQEDDLLLELEALLYAPAVSACLVTEIDSNISSSYNIANNHYFNYNNNREPLQQQKTKCSREGNKTVAVAVKNQNNDDIMDEIILVPNINNNNNERREADANDNSKNDQSITEQPLLLVSSD